MKKFIFIASFFICNVALVMSSVDKPRMTKSIAPHYSGISGRRFYMPSYDEQNLEPIVINLEDLDQAYFINPNNIQTAEDIAIERNRRMRATQLLRSSKKPSGTEAYYFTSDAGLPEGVPHDMGDL